MEFLKTRKAAALVLALSVAFGTLYGSHRSLAAERREAEILFSGDSDGHGHSIRADLDTCLGVTANLRTVALRYLESGELRELQVCHDRLADSRNATQALEAYRALEDAAQAVLKELETGAPLTEQDAGYVSGFRAQLDSAALTMARDPYNDAAEAFNTRVLGRFPANLLGPLTGVAPLPIYQ